MKLVTSQGDVLPMSLRSEEEPAPKKEEIKKEEPPQSEPPDTSIIQEILEKFGGQLQVSDSLVPSTGLEEFEQMEAATQARQEEKKAAREAAAIPVHEQSLIQEILERFGTQLKVSDKLVTSSGLDEEGVDFDDEEDSAPTPEAPKEEIFTPLPLDFKSYMDLTKTLQAFQKSGDQRAYRIWLINDAGPSGKAFVGLRKVGHKERQGESILWEDEYYDLSSDVGVTIRQVKDFHSRMKKYSHLQQKLSRLGQEAQKYGPELVKMVRQIWPQILILLGEEQSYNTLTSNMRTILLQVPDPSTQEQIFSMFDPIFKEIARLFDSE